MLIRHIFAVLLHLGALGLVILGVLDSSFLFLPVGNDLLLVALVAENHGQFLVYVLAASLGSVAGVLLLDLVCRKGGEEGLKKMMTAKRLVYLKKKMQQHAGIALITACLAPPPFPFTTIVAAASALVLLAFVLYSRRGLIFTLGALLIFGDALYVTALNSFYMDTGAYVFLLLAAALYMVS